MTRAALLALLVAVGLPAPAAAQPIADALPRYETLRLGDAPADLSEAGPAGVLPPPPDDWLARDKALHLGGSFLLTLSGQYVLVDKADLTNRAALPIAAGSALALGLAKEVMDAHRPRDPHFCWRDLAADAAGVALAAGLIGL